MNRRAVITTAALTAVAAAITPALASPAQHTLKPLKGTFSYTDVTPDATITGLGEAGKRVGYCKGTLPAAPADVNVHTLKVAGPGTLTVAGANTLDWAMEVRDAKGILLAGSDGTGPTDAEGTVVPLRKAGAYQVIYCNLTGAPTATAAYSYKYR